jgi:hypothetical protein
MEMESIIQFFNNQLNPDSENVLTLKEFTEKLENYINELILSDFDKLLQLLYRVDVSEAKLRRILKENPGENAAKIIAELIIERQIQKKKSRQAYGNRDHRSSDNAEPDAW